MGPLQNIIGIYGDDTHMTLTLAMGRMRRPGGNVGPDPRSIPLSLPRCSDMLPPTSP
jgi:hypothetical protein